MRRPTRGRAAVVLVVLLVVAGLAGCASVPQDSSVQVLRKVTDGEEPAVPPGPVDGTNPLDLVRGFVYASGGSADRHGAARRFLSADAADWNDTSSLTVLDEQFDTVYPPGAVTSGDMATVRIRGTRIGTLSGSGAFAPDESPVEADVTVVRRDGQWRIAGLPDGVLVRQSDFRANYRTVKTYFVDPLSGTVVPDVRYLPAAPARAQAARAIDLLLAGPSPALAGAVTSRLPAGVRLRSNVAESPDGVLIVDLTQVGDLDDPARRLLAAQVVLTLSEVNVGRVRLLVDGAPLLAGKTDLTRDDVTAPGADVAAEPSLVVSGGRVRQLSGGDPGTAVAGQAGNGAFDVASAATSADNVHVALVVRESGRRRLVVGEGEAPLQATDVSAAALTRPTWTPTGSEVWTVADGATVSRTVVDRSAPPRTLQVDASRLLALGGPIQDLRLSRDGMRAAAVVGGRLVTAAVARPADGPVALVNVQVLRPNELGDVVAVDWRAPETVLAVSARADRPVSLVSVDGLGWQVVSGSNLTPPLRAVAATPGRPLLVADQGGVWSFSGGELDTWRQVVGGMPDAVPFYPG